MIYFIRAGDFVKVGRAADPQSRLKELQTAHPKSLRIIRIIPGGSREERYLHGLLKDKRVGGEWFDLTDEEVHALEINFKDKHASSQITEDEYVGILSSILCVAVEMGIQVGVRNAPPTPLRGEGLMIFIPGLAVDGAGRILSNVRSSEIG